MLTRDAKNLQVCYLRAIGRETERRAETTNDKKDADRPTLLGPPPPPRGGGRHRPPPRRADVLVYREHEPASLLVHCEQATADTLVRRERRWADDVLVRRERATAEALARGGRRVPADEDVGRPAPLVADEEFGRC